MVTRQIHVSGLVQGVGFRDALRRKAEGVGVRGWVRNRRDGSVEAVLQGEAQAVAELVRWARRGPASARVEALRESAVEAAFEAEYDAFTLRATA